MSSSHSTRTDSKTQATEGIVTGKRPREIISYNMSQIRSKDTRLEKKLEEILKRTGLKFEKHYDVFGKPDFALPDLRVAIFADSHFWHGYKWNEMKDTIKTRRDFWIPKIERNMKRDREVNKTLRNADWKVIRFWEHKIFNSPDECMEKILDVVRKQKGN